MKRLVFCTLIIIFGFSLHGCFLLDSIIEGQEQSIFNLKSEIVSLKFKTKKIDDDSFELIYSFYDLSGEELTAPETLVLRGNELFIDCRVEKLNSDCSLVFPYSFYTNTIPVREGTVIVYDYNDDGYPEIFTGVSRKEQKKIRTLYKSILTDSSNKDSFRSSPHIMINKKTQEYKLVSRLRGGIEILRNE